MCRDMFFRLTILSIIISCNSNKIESQQITDSFKKYSSLALLKGKVGFTAATCFFVMDSGQLYLISAGHVFNCIDVFKSAYLPEEKQWDSVFIRYYDDSERINTVLRIPISEYKNADQPYFCYNKPDLFCLRLPKLRHFVVEYLDSKLFNLDKINVTPDSVFFYGFKISDSEAQNIHTIDDYNAHLYTGTLMMKIDQNIFLSNLGKEDTLNIALTPESPDGFSGSPVFFKYKSKNSEKDSSLITFGGVAFGTYVENRMAWVVRREQIYKAINYLKRHYWETHYPN